MQIGTIILTTGEIILISLVFSALALLFAIVLRINRRFIEQDIKETEQEREMQSLHERFQLISTALLEAQSNTQKKMEQRI